MSTKWRWKLWLSLLAATIIAVLYPTLKENLPKKKKASAAVSHAALIPVSAPTTQLPQLSELTHDPFEAVTWNAPPVSPAPSPIVRQAEIIETVAPVEPPMPYQFIGRLKNEDGTTTVFLSKGQEGIAVHLGDTLDIDYKLVALDDNKLTIAYLPMDHLHDISLDTH